MQTTFKTLPQLLDFFKDEKIGLEYLEAQRWDGNTVCPHCGTDTPYKTATRSKRTELAGTHDYKCRNSKCHKKFTVLSGTILENSKISIRNWLGAMYLVTAHKKGISSCQLARDLGVTQKTAWFLLHRIREMLKIEAPEKIREDSISEIDEVWIGGKRENKHKAYRYRNCYASPGKDKSIVLGMLERGKSVETYVVPNVEIKTLHPIVFNKIEAGSTVYSDNAPYWVSLRRSYNHASVNHSADEFVRGEISTNGIENFWSLLKRGILGIYHHVSPEHLESYCNEFSYRFNSRKVSDIERFNNTVSKASGKRLTYEQLIARSDIPA
jgi:transposase-like protein